MKKCYYKYTFTTILLFFILLNSEGSNTIGGDITWSCNGLGGYIFKLRLHVQCGGAPLPGIQSLTVFNHPSINTITVNQISQNDISPTCSSGIGINCSSGVPGAVSEYIYVSAPTVLPGTPPPGGWIFTYSECCRNTNTNLNINSGTGITLYSKMFANSNFISNSCPDNSADFISPPTTILCTGNPHSILFFPYDPDLDSISSRWAEPLDVVTGTFTPPINPAFIPFNSGYSFNNPFPNSGAGNSGATLNQLTSKISFSSQISGDYTFAIICESWRCGIKISEVYKEFQLALTNCSPNTAPVINTPFSGGFETTIVAGANVNFTLTANDATSQNVSWNISGDQFGSGFTNSSSGCNIPPCATLNPVPPSTSLGSISTTFNWQTNCSHLESSLFCNDSVKTYRFYFSAQDEQCPVPEINNQIVVIHIKPPLILPSPEIKCIVNGPNNNITLFWEVPADPNNTFSKYVIYHSSSSNGPYDTLNSIYVYNQNQFSFSSPSTGSNEYFFIKSFGCGGFASSLPKDTVRPITLTVNNPSNGTAQLFWNTFVSPLPNSSCGWFKIYKEYPTGIWTLIDSTQNYNYTDTITICQSQINYKIEICDNSGCSSVSNIDGDVFLDQTDPVTPILDSVSIDLNGNAILGWQPSSSQDVYAYVIYQKNGLVYVPVDTIFGNSTFSYNYLPSNASAGTETYVIAAYDSCGNISNLGLPQNTMFLNKQYDVCNFTANLNWNPYINMSDGGIGQYEIIVSINGGPWTLLGTINNTNFSHDSLVLGSTYCYKIVARSVGGDITSVSNQQCLNATTANAPNYLYVSRVTVNNNAINVDGLTDNSLGISLSGFDVFRAKKSDLIFSMIGSVNYSGSATFTFTDNDVSVDKEYYQYYLQIKDSCDNPGIISDTSKSILCTAQALEDFKNKIMWNDYSKWLGGVLNYNIYRSVNGTMNTLPIASIPYTGSGINYYEDDVSGLVSDEGKFEYFIEAIEGPGNPYGIIATVLSNNAVVYREAEVFVPNAFVPRGVNKIFKPVTQFIDRQEYQFSIFDRWGYEIWNTNDFDEGWDGNGVTGGVYQWLIKYQNSRGEYKTKKGHVVLIR
ncbi:MAG: gliding motility-associated C-terminal domain-containing protein [Bacteroidota bacterium]